MIGPLRIDPPLLQAPLAGFTNYAYRQMVRRFGGVGLPATEMVSARGFLHGKGHGRVRTIFPGGGSDGGALAGVEMENRSAPFFPDRLWGVKDEPRPLAVQIWDNDPATLAAVGRRLVESFVPA